MNKNSHIFFVLLFAFVNLEHCAQDTTLVNGLIRKIEKYNADKKSRHITGPVMADTIKINLLNSLCRAHWAKRPEKSAVIATQIVEIAKSLNYKKGLLTGYYSG